MTRNRRRPTAIDLFSGAGGVTAGLKQAGYRVLGAVELDELAFNAYKLNHPRTKVWRRDIRYLPAATIKRDARLRKGQLDLLVACPPCQGFSAIRTRNGVRRNRDPQKDLIFDVLRMARVLKPKVVLLENVPGLARDRRYAAFRAALARMNYRVSYRVLDAAEFGVPQRRKRLVLVATRFRNPLFATPARSRPTVRTAFAKLSRSRAQRDELHNYSSARGDRVTKLIRRIPKDGGTRAALGKDAQLKCHTRIDGFRDVYGRMAWDRPAPTITCGCINPSKGRFLHPTKNRAITLREAAILQSFPVDYQFPLDRGRYAVAAMIGNALPPEFIRRQALALSSAQVFRRAT